MARGPGVGSRSQVDHIHLAMFMCYYFTHRELALQDPRSTQEDSIVIRPPPFPRDSFAYCVPFEELAPDAQADGVAVVDPLLEPTDHTGQLHGVPLSSIRSWNVLPLFEDERHKYLTGYLNYAVSKICKGLQAERAWFRYYCASGSSCGDHRLSRYSRVKGYAKSGFIAHLHSSHGIIVDMDTRRAHRVNRGRYDFLAPGLLAVHYSTTYTGVRSVSSSSTRTPG